MSEIGRDYRMFSPISVKSFARDGTLSYERQRLYGINALSSLEHAS